MCSGAISVWPASRPAACAAPIASSVLRVNLFGSRAMALPSRGLESNDVGGADGHQLAFVLAMCGRDAIVHLALQRVDLFLQLAAALAAGARPVIERQYPLAAGQRDAIGGQLLDAPQELDVVVGVAAGSAPGGRPGPGA